MEAGRIDAQEGPERGRPPHPNGTILSIATSVLVLSGVGAIAVLQMVVYAVGGLGSHSPTADTGTTLPAAGALVALGAAVTLVGRLVWGRGAFLPAFRVALAGVAPFLLGLLAFPKALLALVPTLEIGPAAAGTRLVGWTALGVSVVGVILATRAGAKSRAR